MYKKLQTREGLTVVLSIAVIVFTVAFVLGDFPGRRGYNQTTPTITVSGSGEAVAIPNIARFTFNVTKDAATMAEAQKQSTELANKVVADLQANGIDKKDIKIEGFNAYPKYENRVSANRPCVLGEACPPYNSEPVIVGYTVSTSYSVKVRDIDNASTIAGLLTQANVSNIYGPELSVDDIETYQNVARSRAIADAKTQAKILARQLGVNLIEIVDFQVVGSGDYYPMASRSYAGADMAMAEKAPLPDFQPGQTEVKTQVSITYRIR